MTDALFQLAYIGPGGPEFMMIMLVLLVMFGAKDAPRILRKLNEFINHIRTTADSFKREVMYGDLHDKPYTPPDYSKEPDYYAGDKEGYHYDEDGVSSEEEGVSSEAVFQELEDDLKKEGLKEVPEPEIPEGEERDAQ